MQTVVSHSVCGDHAAMHICRRFFTQAAARLMEANHYCNLVSEND